MPFLGEPVSVPVGVPNPWMLVAQFSLLLLVIFVVDATITVWRRGNHRQALVVGGSIVLLVVLASAQAVAMTWGIMATPLTVSLFYLIFVAAMAYELSYDLIRAAQLNRQLQASEATLRESEQRFRIVADAAPVLIWMSGVDKRCTFFNKRWLEFTGRSLEQEMGNGWAEGVHREDLQKCLRTYTEAFDVRKPFVMQYRLRRNDGEYRWISDDGVPRFDADGAFAGYIGSCVDVTDLLRQQRALHQFEERVALAAEAAQLGVWEFDTTTDRIWISDKVRQLFQFPPDDEITYSEFQKRVHPDDRAARDRIMRRAIQTQAGYETEYRIVLPDGTIRWIGGRARCLPGGDGKSTRLLGVSMEITERKQAEDALRESEERFRTMANTAPVMIWMSGTDKLYTFLNNPWLEFTGRTLDQELGNGWAESVHPDDLQMCLKIYTEAFDAGRSFVMQYRLRRHDGEYRRISDNGVPRYDAQGKFVGYIGSCVDVTELMNKERALRESEERMSLAAEAANLAVWEWDLSTDEVWTTGTHGEPPGRPISEERTLESFISRLHIDDRDRVRQALKAAVNSGEDFASEFRFKLPDGRLRWATARGRCIKTPDGKNMRFRGVSMDVTAQKDVDDLFRLATESSPSGIVLVNDQGRIILVNTHGEKLFGYQREELIGKTVDILVPERFASQLLAHRAKFLAAPTTVVIGIGRDLFARRKDGSEFPVEIGLNPIQTPDGILVLATVVDISARKAAEEETRRNREQVELLSRVSLLGEMTASLAHELNQPLAAIVNNATAAMQYLEQGRLNPEQLQEILNDVVGDGRRACDIMHNVRRAIKKGSAIRGRINLNDVVKAVTLMVQPDAAAHFCKMEMSLAADLPVIEGDPTQIQQVLINLMSNAFDAMHETPPSNRTVEIATSSNGDGSISVAVRDHGCGISEPTRERLFEQFFTTKEEGLGMGLAIVRSIVEAHGGSIAAENADGGGARFHFRLPIKEETPT
jgi:PAS domain S-box-containing protein